MSLYPLLLQPQLHPRVWGGQRLATHFGKTLPSADPYGESWECHDTCVVLNGAQHGRTLGDLLAEFGHDLIGKHNDPAQGLPLLAKFLDTADWLSVQVHPDDAQAAALEGEPRGKTEAWYILAAAPDARLVMGVTPGTTRAQMAAAIGAGTLENHLVYADVRAGDVLFIPAGTVHALGPGLLIYEIQQSSDTTYRLYDWNRVGLDGKPRPLHVEKGVQVSNVEALPPLRHVETPGTSEFEEIITSPYFVTELCALHEENRVGVERIPNVSMEIFTCIEGELRIIADEHAQHEVRLKQGQTALIPACLRRYELHGNGQVLISAQPPPTQG